MRTRLWQSLGSLSHFARVAMGWFLAITLFGVCQHTVAAEPGGSHNPFMQKAQPAPAKQKPARSNLDDALLDDLDNELLEGAGNLKKKPAAEPGAPAGEKDQPRAGDAPVIDGEDIGQPPENDDPLVHISNEMRLIEDLIPKPAQRPGTEELGRRIVDDLNKLIEQAEAQRASQQSAAQQQKKQSAAKRQSVKQPKPAAAGQSDKNSNKPAQDSTDRLGKADEARPDPEKMRSLMQQSWGNLPPRAREEMWQNSPERFLPQYELMIEKYYRRLAEEQRPK